MLMLWAIALPILGGGALLAWRPESRPARQRYVLAVACLTAALSLGAVLGRLGEGALVLLRLGEHLSVALRVDGLSALFAGMVSLLWPLACLYALEYMEREGHEDRFFAFYLAAFGVTLGVAFSANLVTLYFFYELLTLVTLPLVMHAMDGKARYAGRVYLTYSMSGTALAFISMVILIQAGGGTFLLGGGLGGAELDVGLLRAACVLGFFGFGVKAAVFPLHTWLLRASVAPTPVTALLHAVAVVKSGVFAVIRLLWYGFGPGLIRDTWAQGLMLAAVILTILVGSAQALRTRHLKRRLAWSTVSNLSYILLGAVLLTPAGLVAGAAHMIFHAVLKITLFFGVGAIHCKLHRDTVDEIEGCGPIMPAVFSTFAVASLGLIGVPPLAGFSSKWMLATASAGLGRPLGWMGAAALAASAVLTALYLMEIVLLAFFPRQNRAISVKIPRRARQDPGWRMCLPLVVLAAASLLLGAAAGPIIQGLEALLL